jgi:hypothetical protein
MEPGRDRWHVQRSPDGGLVHGYAGGIVNENQGQMPTDAACAGAGNYDATRQYEAVICTRAEEKHVRGNDASSLPFSRRR